MRNRFISPIHEMRLQFACFAATYSALPLELFVLRCNLPPQAGQKICEPAQPSEILRILWLLLV